MYTTEEIETALEREPLREVLYKMEQYARSNKIVDLADWCSIENKGYSNDAGLDDVGMYRFVNYIWRDVYGKPILNIPHYAARAPFRSGIQEFEVLLKPDSFLMALHTKFSEILSQQGILCQGGLISYEEGQSLLGRVRMEARTRWHSVVPRQPDQKEEYPAPNFSALVTDGSLRNILISRWNEANVTLNAGAYLSTVILLGSILEGVLLSKMEQNPREANTAASAPKKDGKVLLFREWMLDSMISVAHECGWIKKDVRDFSVVVRDYRNFVHPNKEREQGVTITATTCRVTFEVVRGALEV